jgi:hypothetical protein
MSHEEAESNSVSPVLKADWFNSRWGREDQRGNGNLMTREKVLEATQLIKTGEIVSLGMPYDARMPIARQRGGRRPTLNDNSSRASPLRPKRNAYSHEIYLARMVCVGLHRHGHDGEAGRPRKR